MSTPLKLFMDGPWTETCFPIRPHNSELLSERKIMADSVVVEVGLLTNTKWYFRIESHKSTYYARADWLTIVGVFFVEFSQSY